MAELTTFQWITLAVLSFLALCYVIAAMTRSRPSVHLETPGLILDMQDCQLPNESIENLIVFLVSKEDRKELMDQSLDDRG